MEIPPNIPNSRSDPFLMKAEQVLKVFGLEPPEHYRLKPDRTLLHLQFPKGERDPHARRQFERRFPRPYVQGLREFMGDPSRLQMATPIGIAQAYAHETDAIEAASQSMHDLDALIESKARGGLVAVLGMEAILNINHNTALKWVKDERFGFDTIQRNRQYFVTAESLRESYQIVPPVDEPLAE